MYPCVQTCVVCHVSYVASHLSSIVHRVSSSVRVSVCLCLHVFVRLSVSFSLSVHARSSPRVRHCACASMSVRLSVLHAWTLRRKVARRTADQHECWAVETPVAVKHSVVCCHRNKKNNKKHTHRKYIA